MDVQDPPHKSGLFRGILLFFVILMIFSCYSNTFFSPPYLDDYHAFIQEKSLYLSNISVSSLLSLSETKFGWTRLIPMITFALNHTLGESRGVYFHAVNILVHLLVFFSVFWFVRLILIAEKRRNPEGLPFYMAGYFPICVAALWALNPVQTNAVTYIVQRMASIQAMFYILSVSCFIKARMLEGNRFQSALFYLLCSLAALCSFLSKENSALLPLMLICTDVWFFDGAWVRKAWSFCRRTGWKTRSLAAIVFIIACIYAVYVTIPGILSGYDNRHFTPGERLLTEGRVVVWYISLLLWPAPSRLSVEHTVELSTSFLTPLSTIPALLLIFGLIYLAVRFRKKFPVITYGIAWFFLNIAVESSIIPLELVFEHRLYLPSVGFFMSVTATIVMLLKYAMSRMSERDFTKAVCSLLLLVASCSALMTFIRNADWEDRITLYYDAVLKAPDSPRTNSNLAFVLNEFGQYDEALRYAEKSLSLSRRGFETYVVAHNAIINALAKTGRIEEAVSRGTEFLANRPKDCEASQLPEFCLNLAKFCIDDNKPMEAYNFILEALKFVQITENSIYKKEQVLSYTMRLMKTFAWKDLDLDGDGIPDPGELSAMNWAAKMFKNHGEDAYARAILEREYANDPADKLVENMLMSWKKEDALNRTQKEKWNFVEKYVRQPFSKFNFCMAFAFLVQERPMPQVLVHVGEKLLDKALEIEPHSPDALLLKGWYLFNKEDATGAAATARKALESDPTNAKVWLGMGFFLSKAGAVAEAASAFEKVIEFYPGYSRRAALEDMCARLRNPESLQPVSSNQNESRRDAGLPIVPAS